MRWMLIPLAAGVLWGQNAGHGFEVASVKLDVLPPGTFRFASSNGGATSAPRISGNRISISLNLAGLVAAAYNVKAYQVAGAPHWSDSRGGDEFYRIDARTEGDGTPSLDYVRQCLQSLLADRFQLRVHRQTADLPIYNLVVGRNGSKLKESAGDGEPLASGGPGGLFRIRAFNRSIADLINLLMANVDRPVLDKTGLAGRYDYTLEYTRSNPDVGADNPDDRSIFAAVQQQLGLKLVPATGPIEIVFIDHAEKPSAN
jgi:uncharacterized protein (TIGR03435 family)